MRQEFAPVVLFAYSRLDHLKKTLRSLEDNHDSDKTELFIFSDASKDDNDRESVANVRAYLNTFASDNHFKNCRIYESVEHKGLAKSVISGVTELIDKYGSSIVVEDDLVLSPFFLQYMNGALSYFENDLSIWSISGYTPNLPSLTTYTHQLFLNHAPCSWGWATWKNRWDKIDWTVSGYKSDRFNPLYYYRMSRGGNLFPSMLRAQLRGELDSWGVRWVYNAHKYNMLTVYPRKSLVRNIGFDSSGTHCGDDMMDKYDVSPLTSGVNFDFGDYTLSRKINRDYYRFNSMSLTDRIREKIRTIKKN